MSRLLLLLLLAVQFGCSGPRGEEVVRGFHGYPWGTEPHQIPEIAGQDPVGEKDGLVIYSTEVEHLGRSALAGFYFHPRTGGLVEGYYVVPVALEECESEWARYVQDLERSYRGLMREERIPTRPAADSARYVSDCEYFLYRGDIEEWTTAFVNPQRPHDRAGLWLRTVGRSLRITAFYQGGDARAWEGRIRWRLRLPRRPGTAPAPPPSPAPPGSEGLPFGRA